MRVLLLEDDAILGEGLRDYLRGEGHVVDWFTSLRELQAVAGEPYDAWLLDWQLPDGSGLAWLAARRRAGDATPSWMLTARDALRDRVDGLDAGADDYLVKPVDLGELAARLRALVRRAHGAADTRLTLGEVTLDPAARQVWRGDQPVLLSLREFDLLHAFMRQVGRVLTREQLEQQLYAWGSEVSSNAVEVHIHNLRRKLGGGLIETVRGVGYVARRPPT